MSSPVPPNSRSNSVVVRLPTLSSPATYPMQGWREQECINIQVPAKPAYVPLLRKLGSAVAALTQMYPARLDDVELAVGEACVLLLPHLTGSEQLELAAAVVEPHAVMIDLLVFTHSPITVERKGLPWRMLRALTDTIEITNGTDFLLISMEITSHPPTAS